MSRSAGELLHVMDVIRLAEMPIRSTPTKYPATMPKPTHSQTSSGMEIIIAIARGTTR